MKKLYMVGLMCLLLQAGQYAFAQSGQEPKSESSPSLQETMDFIKGKIPILEEGIPINEWGKIYKHTFKSDSSNSEKRSYISFGYLNYGFSPETLMLVARIQIKIDSIHSTGVPGKPYVQVNGYQERVVFKLADINPSSIKVDRFKDYNIFTVDFETTDSKKLVSVETLKHGTTYFEGIKIINEDTHQDEKEMRFKHYLWFYSEDTASRVAKALIHAVKLSGGKKELF